MLVLVVGLRAWFQCKEGMYNYWDYICITAAECHSMDENYHAYKAIWMCLYTYLYGANKPILQEDGSYECKDNLYLKLDYSNNRAMCVEPKNECDGFYIL